MYFESGRLEIMKQAHKANGQSLFYTLHHLRRSVKGSHHYLNVISTVHIYPTLPNC